MATVSHVICVQRTTRGEMADSATSTGVRNNVASGRNTPITVANAMYSMNHNVSASEYMFAMTTARFDG